MCDLLKVNTRPSTTTVQPDLRYSLAINNCFHDPLFLNTLAPGNENERNRISAAFSTISILFKTHEIHCARSNRHPSFTFPRLLPPTNRLLSPQPPNYTASSNPLAIFSRRVCTSASLSTSPYARAGTCPLTRYVFPFYLSPPRLHPLTGDNPATSIQLIRPPLAHGLVAPR